MHRTQILFPKWLNNFVDVQSDHCKISKGEMIRSLTCLGILKSLEARNRPVENYQLLLQQLKEVAEAGCVEAHAKVSDFHDTLFFETRKAVEAELEIIKKQNAEA